MAAKSNDESVDTYLDALPAALRPVLERVRATIRKALPGAEEGISYRIPVYKLGGRMVLYFAGFAHHYSIYPASERVLGELGEELEGRLQGKATLRFSYADPVPTRLLARIAKARAAEVAATATAKAARRAKGTRAKPAARGRPARRRSFTRGDGAGS